MKTGIAVIDCPRCQSDRLHMVVLIGPDIYLCCRECRAVTFADAGLEPPAETTLPSTQPPPRYLL
jgi:hypothetical protein